LTKPKASRVIGIDASTNSLAYAIFENGKPVECNEIVFEGADVFERLKDAKKKTAALVQRGTLRADYIAIESAIMVRNVQTAIDLAYVYGAIIGELMASNPQVHRVAPISWQTGIGNPNLTRVEKEKLKHDHPGHKESWYKNEGRKLRKKRTMEIAGNYFATAHRSDNISDAIGIALYVSQALTRS